MWKMILPISGFLLIINKKALCSERLNRIDLETPSDEYINLLIKRKSKRNYTKKFITLKELSYILYAANARTPKGNRTTPSAGALYPVDLYINVNKVIGLNKGMYYYNPRYHYITPIKYGDFSNSLFLSTFKQTWVKDASINIIMCYTIERMKPRYGDKALNYAYIEAGHISQNILLAVTKLELGAVPVGAFDNNSILNLFAFNENEKVILYINSIGNIK